MTVYKARKMKKSLLIRKNYLKKRYEKASCYKNNFSSWDSKLLHASNGTSLFTHSLAQLFLLLFYMKNFSCFYKLAFCITIALLFMFCIHPFLEWTQLPVGKFCKVLSEYVVFTSLPRNFVNFYYIVINPCHFTFCVWTTYWAVLQCIFSLFIVAQLETIYSRELSNWKSQKFMRGILWMYI